MSRSLPTEVMRHITPAEIDRKTAERIHTFFLRKFDQKTSGNKDRRHFITELVYTKEKEKLRYPPEIKVLIDALDQEWCPIPDSITKVEIRAQLCMRCAPTDLPYASEGVFIRYIVNLQAPATLAFEFDTHISRVFFPSNTFMHIPLVDANNACITSPAGNLNKIPYEGAHEKAIPKPGNYYRITLTVDVHSPAAELDDMMRETVEITRRLHDTGLETSGRKRYKRYTQKTKKIRAEIDARLHTITENNIELTKALEAVNDKITEMEEGKARESGAGVFTIPASSPSVGKTRRGPLSSKDQGLSASRSFPFAKDAPLEKRYPDHIVQS